MFKLLCREGGKSAADSSPDSAPALIRHRPPLRSLVCRRPAGGRRRYPSTRTHHSHPPPRTSRPPAARLSRQKIGPSTMAYSLDRDTVRYQNRQICTTSGNSLLWDNREIHHSQRAKRRISAAWPSAKNLGRRRRKGHTNQQPSTASVQSSRGRWHGPVRSCPRLPPRTVSKFVSR